MQELLGRRNAEVNLIVEIGKALTSKLDIQELFEEIMDKVAALLKPKAWSLLLVDPETEELEFKIAVSPVSGLLKNIRLKSGEGIAGWVALHGEPLLVPDVQKDDRFAPYVDMAVGFETRSIICIPLKIRERTLGVIQVINSLAEIQYNDSDLKLLSAIADYAAIALANAQNFEKINELLITDDLTGLFNAKHFHSLLDYEVERSKRYGTELSLVFLDLDHFKKVNDRHGHLVGSRIIAEFGQLIGHHIRGTDIAARYGGDEFVIIAPNTGRDGVFQMVSHLRNIVLAHQFFSDDGDQINLTASYGIASYPADANTKRELIQLADQAMYELKSSTRNGVRLFERNHH
jgi:diguanylate cyclase (GGDEF)-like protein